jgi:hypothetical protein
MTKKQKRQTAYSLSLPLHGGCFQEGDSITQGVALGCNASALQAEGQTASV